MASTSSSFNSYHADAFGAANGVLEVSKQPWGEFLGSPNKSTNIQDYDIRNRDTYILPEAYEGKNQKLGEEVEFLAYTDQNFYTTIVMPFMIVREANYVTWSKTVYERQMPTHVPELGVSRILSSHRVGKTASFERRGLSYFFEHGFMNTEAGRVHYQNTLKQMTLNILELAKFDVIYTLLTSQESNMLWEKKFGVYKSKRLADLFANQIWMWACLQKFPNSLALLDSRVQDWMSRYRGEADTWIFSPQIQSYMQTVPPERLEFYRAGPAGPQRIIDGPRALMSVGTAQAFFARTYDIERTGTRPVLSAPAQIGEYAEMRDRERDTNYDNYVSKSRHARIYDETADEWFELKLRWALENCQRFDPKTGELLAESDVFDPNTDDLEGAQADLFSYVDADTGMRQQTRLFGHMEEAYFPAGDKLNLAKTAVAALVREYAARNKSFVGVWSAGTNLIDRIDSLGLPGDVASAAALGAGEGEGPDVNAPQATPATLFKQMLDASTKKVTLVAGDLESLLPGLQSYEGLGEISQATGKHQETAADFVKAIKDLVARLRTFFPGSHLLDSRFASKWWKQPSAETTFFENAVARSRIPLFNIAATTNPADKEKRVGKTASDATFERIYKEERAAANARRGDAVPAANLPDGLGAEWTPEQKRVAIAAATLLAAAGKSNSNPQKTHDIYVMISQKIAEIVGVEDGTYTFAKAISRDQLVEAVRAAAGVAYGKGDVVRTRLAAIAEQLRPDAKRPDRTLDYADGADFKATRTTILAGPRLVRELAAKALKGENLTFVPASPTNPEVPMTYAELQRLGEEWRDEASDISDAMADEEAPASGSIPAFEGALASELSPHTAHLQLVLNADAAGAGAASAGASLGAGFGDDDDFMASARRGRRVRASDDAAGESTSASLRRAWRNVRLAAGGNRLLASIAHVYDFTPVRKLPIVRWIENDIVVPIAFVVARPHATYEMLTGIKCLAGPRMGAYLHQPGRFELGDDAEVQAHFASYTYKSKAFVKDENHVFIARNIFAAGYHGGLGKNTFDPETYQAGGRFDGQESIFVLAVPYASGEADGAPISLTGQAEINGQGYSLAKRPGVDYIGVRYYNAKWGWRQANNTDDSDGAPRYESITEQTNQNMLCFRGLTWYYNKKDGEFTVLQRGNGHWGDRVYIGCSKVRAGHYERFEEARYNYVGFTEA